MGGNSNNGARWYLAQSTPAEAPRNTCGGGVLSCRYTAVELLLLLPLLPLILTLPFLTADV